ncbi:MAG TPA: CDGSH iron-sulfur domain-containing protein [Nocardioidaceae bacterium]
MRLVENIPEPVSHGVEEVEVTPCPDGPLLVRGADAVRDRNGELHPTTRPVVAVCTCDKSQRMPWCDGTHKVVRRAAQAMSRARKSPPA